MTFAQQQNCVTTHFSERFHVFNRRVTVYEYIEHIRQEGHISKVDCAFVWFNAKSALFGLLDGAYFYPEFFTCKRRQILGFQLKKRDKFRNILPFKQCHTTERLSMCVCVFVCVCVCLSCPQVTVSDLKFLYRYTVLITRPNTSYISSTTVLVQCNVFPLSRIATINRCQIHKLKNEGRETCRYSVTNYNTGLLISP